MPRASCYRKTGYPNYFTTKTLPAIQFTIFIIILDISDIPFFPPAFLIEAYSSSSLSPI